MARKKTAPHTCSLKKLEISFALFLWFNDRIYRKGERLQKIKIIGVLCMCWGSYMTIRSGHKSEKITDDVIVSFVGACILAIEIILLVSTLV